MKINKKVVYIKNFEWAEKIGVILSKKGKLQFKELREELSKELKKPIDKGNLSNLLKELAEVRGLLKKERIKANRVLISLPDGMSLEEYLLQLNKIKFSRYSPVKYEILKFFYFHKKGTFQDIFKYFLNKPELLKLVSQKTDIPVFYLKNFSYHLAGYLRDVFYGLVRDGLLRKQRVELVKGRKKNVYGITEKGLKYVNKWLNAEINEELIPIELLKGKEKTSTKQEAGEESGLGFFRKLINLPKLLLGKVIDSLVSLIKKPNSQIKIIGDKIFIIFNKMVIEAEIIRRINNKLLVRYVNLQYIINI